VVVYIQFKNEKSLGIFPLSSAAIPLCHLAITWCCRKKLWRSGYQSPPLKDRANICYLLNTDFVMKIFGIVIRNGRNTSKMWAVLLSEAGGEKRHVKEMQGWEWVVRRWLISSQGLFLCWGWLWSTFFSPAFLRMKEESVSGRNGNE